MNRKAINLGFIGLIPTLCFGLLAGAAIDVEFTPPVELPVGGAGGDVTTGDIDNDGDLDIITTTRNPYFFWVSINTGGGGFAPATQHAAGTLPRAVIAVDFNNDTNLDIMTANELVSDVTLMTGDGAGGFSLPRHFITAMRPMELASGDFNNDGLPDLAVTHKDSVAGVVVVRLNSGGVGAAWSGLGPATSYSVGAGSRSVTALDIDTDGDLDLVTTNRADGTVSVLLGDGFGDFGTQLVFPAGVQPRDLTAGDFTGDGIIDLAIADFGTGEALILPNLGVDLLFNTWNGLGPAVAYPGGGLAPHGIASGDLDIDGDLDLIVANVQSGNLSVMLNDGAGAFDDSFILVTGAFSAASVSIVDLDDDGDLDVVNANAESAGSSTIFFNATKTCPADFNNDGIVDTADLGVLLNFFNQNNSHVDLNADGVIDTADLGILLGVFGVPCPTLP